MQVKIDTKEKFHVITPIEPVISATMTDGIKVVLLPYLNHEVHNLVLNLENVERMEKEAIAQLLQIQQQFYGKNSSFVVCCLQKNVEEEMATDGMLELFNVTPTESEAWDIVQMEILERELMDAEDWEEAGI